MYNLNYAPTNLGYKVEWKSVSRGTGGKRLNTTGIVCFCSVFRRMQGNCTEVGHDQLISNPFIFTVHDHFHISFDVM
jgi:hypothetical protein